MQSLEDIKRYYEHKMIMLKLQHEMQMKKLEIEHELKMLDIKGGLLGRIFGCK